MTVRAIAASTPPALAAATQPALEAATGCCSPAEASDCCAPTDKPSCCGGDASADAPAASPNATATLPPTCGCR